MIIPYLLFHGTCDEAIKLYTSVLGAELKRLSRYTAQTGGPAIAGKVMHMR